MTTTQTKESQAELTPPEALQLLREGNERFLEHRRVERNLLEQVRVTARGQHPFAVILGCIDSRASTEIVFDQGIGDVFSIRVAGNVVNDDVLGSMEFACKVAGAMLIVVKGHTRCGAVSGACQGVELGHLTGLLSKIRPAVEALGPEVDLEDPRVQDSVCEEHVRHAVQEIRRRSRVLDDLITSGQVGIVGAVYSVEDGSVTFGELECGTPHSA